MLYLNKTRIVRSKHSKVASTAVIEDEGQALVVVDEGGNLAVRPSTGAAGEKFFGFAMFERQMPKVLPQVIRVIGTGAEQIIPLSNLVGGSARATVNGVAAGANVTFQANQATVLAAVAEGAVVEIAFSKNATVVEAQRLVGHTWDRTALTAGAQVGAIQDGEVYVTNFDTSVAWTVGDAAILGPNGSLTKGGTGAAVPNAMVIFVPKAGEAYLGIELR